MSNAIYAIWENRYPEDWILVYATTELEAINKFCSENNSLDITLEKFYNELTIGKIDSIDGRVIKEIIFED